MDAAEQFYMFPELYRLPQLHRMYLEMYETFFDCLNAPLKVIDVAKLLKYP
jgi:hypothetical protein